MTLPFAPSFDLAGRRALVTGASSGFGARFARVLAAAGADVALAARRTDRIEALAEELRGAGRKATAVALDVTNAEAIPAAFDAVEAALGPVDIIINNAGMNARGLATDIAVEDFDRVMAVNVRGVFLVAREGARRMIAGGSPAHGRGRVINIGSIGGLKVLPGLTAYCTSKAAVVMMTRSLAREWARHGVCVNAICPGYVETEINADWLAEAGGQKMVQGFPRRRLMRDADLDATLLMLASDAGAFITGSVITLDDGQSL
jgi:NAD(P)-dependent dehydrogenase (short-subunit alcohol dehydrogenase family)